MEFESLKYADETDKSYGLAGMAISLMAWNAEQWLESISIDADADEGMRMSADYYLTLAPRVGAKAVWEQSLKRFQIAAAMTVANVACRELSRHRHGSLPAAADSDLRKALTREGAELCALDDDEVSRIYGKSLSYCSRLFTHPGVNSLADRLAEALRQRRTMQSTEVFEILAPLSNM